MNTKMNGIFPSTARKLSNGLLAADNIDALRRKMLTAVLKIFFDERSSDGGVRRSFFKHYGRNKTKYQKNGRKKEVFHTGTKYSIAGESPEKTRFPRG